MYALYGTVLGIPAPQDWAPAVGAAAIAGAAALLSAIAATVRGPRERRRALYSRAFEDALAWQEGLYRVRRRDNTPEQERQLVEHFHGLQERINHHRAWLASESIFLANSYCRFVAYVKAQCLPLINASWQSPGEPPTSPEHASKPHPQGVDAEAARFLLDVRLHLWSALLVPSIVLWLRNRKP